MYSANQEICNEIKKLKEMSQKTIGIIGWILTALVGSMLLMSAFMKLTLSEMAVEQAAAAGFSSETYRLIGVVELFSLLLFLFPRTGVLGTLLLAAYLGGAIATHLQHQESFLMPAIIQAVLWIAAVLRFPELKQRILQTK